jgi:hypothetical protein
MLSIFDTAVPVGAASISADCFLVNQFHTQPAASVKKHRSFGGASELVRLSN